MNSNRTTRSSRKARIAMLLTLMPLVMAAECDSGDSSSGVLDLIVAIFSLVLAIIGLT